MMSGKDKGKEGTITRALPAENKVVIDGIGMIKRHIKATRTQAGQIIARPRAIDASNVMLLDPTEKKPTRIGRRTENGKTVRFAKRSNSTLS